jgi:hypothetical protein
MAVEVHVFFRGKLPTKSALNKAMKELGFPISIKPARGSLEKQSGFMPMLLRREETGAEFDVFEGQEHIAELGLEDVDPSYDRTASFRWGGDENEMLCGLCAAATLAQLMNGVVFDEENLMSTDAAIEMARKALGKPEKSKRKREPGTRPADIKRYLKPLLELRSDLALLGRLLIIRPVRHILRGAYFEPTSDKYSFCVHRHIGPLYLGGEGLGDDNRLSWTWQVWEPDFQPLLLDVLAREVFENSGKLTTFDALADNVIETTLLPGLHTVSDFQACVVVPALAGRPERAAEFVREIERRRPRMKDWVKEHLDFLDRDISTVCAEFHDKEARIAKVAQLGDLWEPSPFPVELPPSQRNQVAEPLFVPTPWIAPPTNFFAEAPERPGEVRFARKTFVRDGRLTLLTPLTRTEAEDEHRQFESYSLVVRLADGLLLVLNRRTNWDRNRPIPSYADPNLWGPTSHAELGVWLYTPSYFVSASLAEGLEVGSHRFRELRVYDRDGEIWRCNHFPSGRKEIRDARSGEETRTMTRISDADVELATFAMPAFGQFEGVVERLRALLHNAGYGDLT